MFFWSHFQKFFSDPIRKQSAMSQRSSPMTKSRFRKSAIATPRPVNWVCHSLLIKRNTSSPKLGGSNNLVNAQVEQGGVSSSVVKLTRDTSQHRGEQSQGNRETLNTQNPRTQAASGNGCEVWRDTRTGLRWNFISCKSRTINSWQRFSRICRISWISWEHLKNSSKFGIEAIETKILMWSIFMSPARKAASHLGQNYIRIWKCTITQTSRKKRLSGTTQRMISEHSEEIFNVKLTVHLFHGRDLLCFMIKRSCRRKQKYMFTQILFYA